MTPCPGINTGFDQLKELKVSKFLEEGEDVS